MNRFIHFDVCLLLLLVSACQQEEITPRVNYSEDIYERKEYKLERHPTVARNGFGMDIYHDGNSGLDTCYLKTDTSSFTFDLIFYNELAYTLLSNGDYGGSGYPVIFLYTDTLQADHSAKAYMVGQGCTFFDCFNADSITADRVANLKSDPYVALSNYRTELHTDAVNGFVLLETVASALYSNLTIGNKFRPNIGGVFELNDVSDEAQLEMQPVFLLKTREGLYAKFMVTRFKGVGLDAQKLILQWQAIKK